MPGSECTPSCPCGDGGGDCDSNLDCVPGLLCKEEGTVDRCRPGPAADALRPKGTLILTTPNRWVQERRSRAEQEAWGLQPIEKWVDAAQLRRLLEPRFELLTLRTIVPGYGTRGLLAIVNSPKLRRLLGALAMGRLYDALRCRLGMGLHLVALARRR